MRLKWLVLFRVPQDSLVQEQETAFLLCDWSSQQCHCLKSMFKNVVEAASPEVVIQIKAKRSLTEPLKMARSKFGQKLAPQWAVRRRVAGGWTACVQAVGRQAPEKVSSIQMVLVCRRRRVAADLPHLKTKSFLKRRSQREVGLTFWPT